MKDNRAATIGGMILILTGVVFLVNLVVPGVWALSLVGAGIFFLAYSYIQRKAEFIITGMVVLVLGLILLYQSLTQDWSSWYALWPLIFASVGAGMLLMIPLEPDLPQERSSKYYKVSLGFTIIGLIFTAVLWAMRPWLDWPVLIWGPGILFAITSLFSGLGPFMIPACVLGGIGSLLAYQNATGDWVSWVYAWTLIPAFVGLGLFLAFLNNQTVRTVGLSMLGWSMVAFAIFGLAFAREGKFAQYWPLALVITGLVLLLQALITPRKTGNT
jgi:hypothetical protein